MAVLKVIEANECEVEAADLKEVIRVVEMDAALDLVVFEGGPFEVGAQCGGIVFVPGNGEKEERF